MARYRYTAVDRDGRTASGQIEAFGLDDARARLAALGLEAETAVLEVEAEAAAGPGRLSAAEAAGLGGQIASLAKGGLPLGPGLRAMAEEFPGGRARGVLRRLADRIDAGLSLDAALAAEGPRVPEHLRCLLEAAVRSGRFAEVIDEMVAVERTRLDARHRLGLAFAYPLFLLAVILLIYGMSVYIVPQFGKIYADFGTQLPVLTQVMLRICSPLAVSCVLAMILLAVLVVLIALGGRTRSAAMQRALYRLPIVGPIWRFRSLAEFSRLTGLLLELNVPLPQALRAVAGGLREGDLRVAARALAEQVESGVPFSDAMARRREFPATFKPLVRWGEQTPALADAFRGTAEMCEGRLRFQGMFADAILLPVMLVVVVFFVGVFIASLMLPMINLITHLS